MFITTTWRFGAARQFLYSIWSYLNCASNRANILRGHTVYNLSQLLHLSRQRYTHHILCIRYQQAVRKGRYWKYINGIDYNVKYRQTVSPAIMAASLAHSWPTIASNLSSYHHKNVLMGGARHHTNIISDWNEFSFLDHNCFCHCLVRQSRFGEKVCLLVVVIGRLVSNLDSRETRATQDANFVFASLTILFGDVVFGTDCNPEPDKTNKSIKPEEKINPACQTQLPRCAISGDHDDFTVDLIGQVRSAAINRIENVVDDRNNQHIAKGIHVLLRCRSAFSQPRHLHTCEQLM